MCTESYEAPTPDNIDNACMHLTNYAVNKTSAKFRGAVSGGYNPEEDQADVSAGGVRRAQHVKLAKNMPLSLCIE